MHPVIKQHPKQPIPKRKEVWVHMVFLTTSVKFLPTPSCILLTQNNLIPICASWSFFPCKICFQPCWKGSSKAQWRAEKSKSGLGHPQLPLPKVTCNVPAASSLCASVSPLHRGMTPALLERRVAFPVLSEIRQALGAKLHSKEQKEFLSMQLDKPSLRNCSWRTGTCSQVLRPVVTDRAGITPASHPGDLCRFLALIKSCFWHRNRTQGRKKNPARLPAGFLETVHFVPQKKSMKKPIKFQMAWPGFCMWACDPSSPSIPTSLNTSSQSLQVSFLAESLFSWEHNLGFLWFWRQMRKRLEVHKQTAHYPNPKVFLFRFSHCS